MNAFLDEADQLLGSRGLICDAELMEPWLTDWRGRFTGRALAMAAPADTAELAALMRLCSAHGVAVVPQGGNSGMSGGATPDPGGTELLLSMRRMTAIRLVDIEARQATCEAGVILQHLHEAAEAKGLGFALTLGGKGSATVGGLIATNAGGTQVLRHGTMRAQVLGIEAVLADGTVYSVLTPLRKDNRGFDLKQMFIGSEGTLGIVTAATLRLLPAIAERTVFWVGLPTITAARALLLHCQETAGDLVEGFEVLPQSCLDAVLAHQPGTRAPLTGRHAWHALIELASDQIWAEPLSYHAERLLASAMDRHLIEDAMIAASDVQAEALWLLRDSISAAERAKGPAMQHDISVPVARMADFVTMAAAAVEARFAGVHAFGYGHLGDGNIHFHVAAPAGSDRAAWEAGEGKAISRMVHDLVTDWGG